MLGERDSEMVEVGRSWPQSPGCLHGGAGQGREWSCKCNPGAYEEQGSQMPVLEAGGGAGGPPALLCGGGMVTDGGLGLGTGNGQTKPSSWAAHRHSHNQCSIHNKHLLSAHCVLDTGT